VLLSSLEGAAVTGVRIDGARHEYQALNGVREDVMSILLNLKKLRVKLFSNGPETIYLTAKKEGQVTGKMVQENSNVEIVNKDLVIATLEPGVPRVEAIPNIVDARETRRLAAGEPSLPLPDRFLLFVGKLEENKGVRHLVPSVARAKTGLPLVVLGEGSLAHALKFEAASSGITLILRGWTHREDVLRALARATVLVFPSLWPEPLSRVLLEALALGTAVAAMDTGGTHEILKDGESGLLVPDETGLGDAVARIAGDEALAARIAEGARRRAADFSPEALVPRYEAVYQRIR
jgi:glycosyltransferase involved in cell wall biosynthesis